MKKTYNSYKALKKPKWAPPSWLFGPVWAFLYILITVSFGAVFYLVAVGEIPWVIAAPFVLNIVFNLSFTWIQFGLKDNYLAAVDILLVLITLVWAMVVIFPYGHSATYIQIPYLIWVSFATVLQLTITYLNK